jgi:hypothetical protein
MELDRVPPLWYLLCECMFQTGRDMAVALWDHLPNADAVAWQLRVLEARGKGNYKVAFARTQRLAAILSPQAMMQESVSLEPEKQPRSKAVRQYEEAVLKLTNREGTWRC